MMPAWRLQTVGDGTLCVQILTSCGRIERSNDTNILRNLAS